MSKVPGLRDAAGIARHQAAIARGQAGKAAGKGDAEEERWLLLQARTAESLADTYEAEANRLENDDVTEPRALILVECPSCGASVPSRWTPPAG